MGTHQQKAGFSIIKNTFAPKIEPDFILEFMISVFIHY